MTRFNRRCVIVDLSHVFKRRRALKENRNMLEKQATSIEVSPLVLLKHAANLRGHVLEDTAEVLHSLARTSFGGRGTSPLIFVEKNFLKSNRKRAFWGDFADIAGLTETLTTSSKKKMSIAVIVKRRFYMIFRCFAMEDYEKKGENFKFMWSWT